MKFLLFLRFVSVVFANVLPNTSDIQFSCSLINNFTDSDGLIDSQTPVLDANATQKLLFVVFRHAERTLAIKFPNDEYAFNASYWPDGDGQLTIPGKVRMYNLGLYLKDRYKNFITSDIREVKVRSSGLDRCIESAELVLFALYPPKDRWLWNDNVTSFQPIPISSTLPNTDPMINPQSACKNGWKERSDIFNSQFVKRMDEENADLYEHLSGHVGLKVQNLNHAKAVFDVLMVESSMNYTLPNWTNPIVLSKLEKIYDDTFYIEFMTKRAQMFRTGLFFNELHERIQQRLQDKPKQTINITTFVWDPNDFEHYKAFMYSSHDSFISALLVALGNFDMNAPPSGSSILFEVYQNDIETLTKNITNLAKKNEIALNNVFIKFYYLKHTESKNPTQLTLRNCRSQQYCSFSEFFKYTEDIILTMEDWYKKCDE